MFKVLRSFNLTLDKLASLIEKEKKNTDVLLFYLGGKIAIGRPCGIFPGDKWQMDVTFATAHFGYSLMESTKKKWIKMNAPSECMTINNKLIPEIG